MTERVQDWLITKGLTFVVILGALGAIGVYEWRTRRHRGKRRRKRDN